MKPFVLRGLLWLVTLAWAAWQLSHTPIVSDLTHFLPRETSVAERLLVGQMKDGLASRFILMAVEGGDDQALATVSRSLADGLQGSPLFLSVLNGSEALSDDTKAFLLRYRYLLSSSGEHDDWTEPSLHRALQDRLQELASPAGVMTKDLLARDPTGRFLRLAMAWKPQSGPEIRRGVWFSHDGQRALLAIQTRAAGFDLDGQAKAIQAIRASFSRINPNNTFSLVMAGPPVFSVDANASIGQDASRLSILNGFAVAAMLWLVYRSWRVIAIGLVPLGVGALIGAALVGFWFGSLHGITLGFGAALIGVAADYPNHVFTHLEAGENAESSMRRIWPTLRLGVLTNVAGFTAMLFSGFEGLAQLGLFAASGLLAAALAVRWLLPLFMPSSVSISSALLKLAGRLPAFPARWGAVPIVLGIAAAAWLNWVSPGPWNEDIDALSPVPAESKKLDEDLRLELGAPDLRKMILVLGGSPEAVLTRSEALIPRLLKLTEQGAVSGFDSAAQYLPSIQAQLDRQQAIPSTSELRARLQRAGQGLPFRAALFEPFLAEVAQARNDPPLTLESELPEALSLKLRSLLTADGSNWVGLVPLRNVRDEAAIQLALQDLAGPNILLVDLREASSRMVSEYRQEALELLGWSLLAIVLLLGVGLRSMEITIRVLLPMLCAAAVTAALMARAAGGLSLYHLVSLLLVMGLSLDQALFFNRPASYGEDRARTLLSLFLCNASAVVAFGILATSRINILHEIGSTVALGAAVALLFGALLARAPASPA